MLAAFHGGDTIIFACGKNANESPAGHAVRQFCTLRWTVARRIPRRRHHNLQSKCKPGVEDSFIDFGMAVCYTLPKRIRAFARKEERSWLSIVSLLLALTQAAKTLLSSCATESFALSFVDGADGFTIPEGRSRMYITGATATEAAGIASSSSVADTAINLVFLTEFHDTRFNTYGVLRPLDSAE